jgi:hypothetical protein
MIGGSARSGVGLSDRVSTVAAMDHGQPISAGHGSDHGLMIAIRDQLTTISP